MTTSSAQSVLRAQLGTLRPSILRVWIFAVIAGLLSLSPTVYMMEVYGRVITSRSMATLFLLTILVLGVYAVMELLGWVAARMMEHAARDFDERLAPRILDIVFSVTLNKSGGGQQSLGDLRTLREFLYSPAFLAALEAPVSVVFLGIMFAISPILGYFSIFGALIQLVLVIITERKVQPPLAEANIAAFAAQGFANNAQRNAEVVEAMGMREGVHDRWMGLQQRFLYLQARASDYAGSLSTASKSVMLIQGSAGLGLGFWLMTQGHIAHGGVAILGGVVGGKVLQPIVQVVSQWKVVAEARDAFRRLDEVLGAVVEEAPSMQLPAPAGHLSAENVTAGAPGSSVPIIHGVNFSLPAGQCLAVIGPSASGKTTLARVLLGVWPVLSGKVRLDSADVHAWDKSELGPHVGYLPQDVELFEGSIAENIARFGEIDDQKLNQAIKLAGLEALVASWPTGTETQIGVDGAFLSGGQRQRVGLARAAYGAPKFIVLDEPNSSLDEAGDAVLLQMLLELKRLGSTVVVVTHRKTVLPAVDKLLVMREGRAQIFGERDQVLAALQPQAPAAGNA